MPRRESKAQLFAAMLKDLSVEEHPDVLEFVKKLFDSETVPEDLPPMPHEEENRKELMRKIAANEPPGDEMPPPVPEECYELAVFLFKRLKPQEQRLALFNVMIKLENTRYPGLAGAIYEAARKPAPELRHEDQARLLAAMDVATSLILRRELGNRKRLPDLSALSEEDRAIILRAEKRLAHAVAIRHTTSMALEVQTSILLDEDRKVLARLYTSKLQIPAADMLAQSIADAFTKAYQKAGLAGRYIN